jgi:hypothetical protein
VGLEKLKILYSDVEYQNRIFFAKPSVSGLRFEVCKTLNNNLELSDCRRGTMASSSGLVLSIIATLAVSFIFIDVLSAFAQESNNTFINRIAIWDLFYRLMVIAFTVGAVIMGVLAYVIFRFRESNKKNIPREPMEGQH